MSEDGVAPTGPDIDDVYTLAPMQAGMLFHTLERPQASPYVAQIAYEIPNGVDRSAFEQAWHEVMQRHPALRTAFAWKQTSRMVQVVRRRPVLPVTWEDWRGRSAEAQQAALTEYLQRDRARGFDLTWLR